MIAIVNISDPPTERGLNIYSLRINKTEIVQFMHMREQGLDKCLERAAEACRRIKDERTQGDNADI